MTIEQANTPADELQPTIEQAQIQQIDNERGSPEPDTELAPDPSAPPAARDADVRVDPRAARLEQIAENRQEHNADELETLAATMAPPVSAEPVVAAAQERMIKLRIRGEDVELPESEVIARAQKVDAADSYLTEARDLLKEVKQTVKQPAVAAEPEAKPEKIDRLAQAVEMIQVGGDPAEAKALIAEEVREQAQSAAREAVDGTRAASMSARFDSDFQQGFADAQAEYPAVMNDPVLAETVVSFNGALQRHLIGDFLNKADEPIRAAFAQAGITAEGIAAYSPQDTHALYKDMALKGYPLPPPSMVTKSAAKTFAEKFGSLTPPPAVPTPAPQPALDRTARKEAIQQPQRSTLPRQTTQTPPPRTEPQRAASARQEARAARRTGAPVR